MRNFKLLAVAALALVGCGDNLSVPDAHVPDSPPKDPFPAAPTLGAQIDRVGRPAVNTVLNHGFDPTADAQTAKVAYNQNATVANWYAVVDEFKKNLAIIDVLDKGATSGGCGNQAMYNGTGTGTAMSTSYDVLAGVLANDQLFLDTAKSTCAGYLAVESVALVGSYSSCGGRAPQYDVVDFSYSMLAAGLEGFDLTMSPIAPKIKDGVDAHTDYLPDFPYLGPPM